MFLKSILFGLLSFVILTNASLQTKKNQIQNVHQLNEDNWDRMLTGEWMVKL